MTTIPAMMPRFPLLLLLTWLLCRQTAAGAQKARWAGVATFRGLDGVSGYVRFDPTCSKGYILVTVALLGLERRFGRWTINEGSAALPGCQAVLGETFGYIKGKPLVPYGRLSDRHGLLVGDAAIPQRLFLDDVLPLHKFSPVGRVLVLHDAKTGLPRLCVSIDAERLKPKPRPRPGRFGVLGSEETENITVAAYREEG